MLALGQSHHTRGFASGSGLCECYVVQRIILSQRHQHHHRRRTQTQRWQRHATVVHARRPDQQQQGVQVALQELEIAVPKDQRPCNELAQLKQAWGYSWVCARTCLWQEVSPLCHPAMQCAASGQWHAESPADIYSPAVRHNSNSHNLSCTEGSKGIAPVCLHNPAFAPAAWYQLLHAGTRYRIDDWKLPPALLRHRSAGSIGLVLCIQNVGCKALCPPDPYHRSDAMAYSNQQRFPPPHPTPGHSGSRGVHQAAGGAVLFLRHHHRGAHLIRHLRPPQRCK